MEILHLDNQHIDLQTLKAIFDHNSKIELGDTAQKKVQNCRKYLDEKVKNSEELIYGVNTGFGSLRNEAISTEQLGQLQENLVRSHACGTGDYVPKDIVKKNAFIKSYWIILRTFWSTS